jgi:lipid II:glycine glycyltransferase (peptidoglycan interpeptide bridge formation enzyme)
MIKILKNEEYNEWDEFVYNHKYGSIYHTTHWMNIIKKSFNASPVVFIKKNERIHAGLPFLFHSNFILGSKMISISSAQACNPLVSSKEDINSILSFIKEYAAKKKINQLEIKVDQEFEYPIENLYTGHDEFCTFILPLNKPYEEIIKSYHNSCIMRPLKKAIKNNLEIIIGSSFEDVKSFYNLYKRMRKENGLFPQPFNFFKTIWEELKPFDMCTIIHAMYDGKIISSVFNLMYKNTYSYEYGATDKAFIHLNPSHYLLDYSIKEASRLNFCFFDFGRTELTNTGLMDFKKRWGTQKLNLRYYYSGAESKYFKDKKGIKDLIPKIIHLLPEPIYTAAGNLVYRIIF